MELGHDRVDAGDATGCTGPAAAHGRAAVAAAGDRPTAHRHLRLRVCRTDLHVADGEIHGILPIVPGHEIVGRVEAVGDGVTGFAAGDRVGVPWLGHACGHCPWCQAGRENLCDAPLFTGFTRDGGFAS